MLTHTPPTDDIAFQARAQPEGRYEPADLGKSRVLALDVNMLVLLGEAKERTADDYVQLGYVFDPIPC